MSLLETKVFSVLQKFDKYEQNRCRKYIYSPYFNANEQLRQLYDILVKEIAKPSKKGLSKQMVWKEIYPSKKYDDVRIRKHTSELMKLVEGYLTQQFYDEDSYNAAVNLMKVAERKGLDELYKGSIRNANRILEKHKSLSASYFLNKYRMEDYSFGLLFDNESRIDQKPLNYTRALKNLDQFYLAEKLRIYCSILSREYITSHDYEVEFMNEIIEYVSNNIEDVLPNVKVYYFMYLTYKDRSDLESYFKFRDLTNKFSTEFPQKEAYGIYNSLINYCGHQIRAGKKDFFKELFSIYKEMNDNGTIVINNSIHPAMFRNVVAIASNIEEYEWAENFISDNKEKLAEDQRENLVTFNLARLYFAQKKYDQVTNLLREVEYSDISLALQAKTILLMTYFDTDELDPLESFLESFRVYLNRHKEIPQQRKDYFKNLIKFTKKLTRIIPGDKEAVAKIKKEIEETENFRVRWLEEKIGELE